MLNNCYANSCIFNVVKRKQIIQLCEINLMSIPIFTIDHGQKDISKCVYITLVINVLRLVP